MSPADMNDLMKQAQQMQAQLMAQQAAAADTIIEGHSGGGMVKVEVNGLMEFRNITIDPKVIDPSDVEMLQDLVLAAIHDAAAKVQANNEEAMGNLGGMFG